MKYYNKKWYDLIQKIHYTIGVQPIPDKEYTDEEIKELYNKKLNEYIESEKQSYNEQPDFSLVEEILNEEEFDSNQWLFVNEKTNQTVVPSSKEEVINHLEQEKAQALNEFSKRKPFDEKTSRKDFEKMYKHMLRLNAMFLKWVYDAVDKRLIALELLPQSIFNKLQEEENINKEKLEAIESEATKELNKQNIKSEIKENFFFHDGILKSFKQKDNDIVMKIDCFDSFESIIKTVIFKNAEIIQMEKIENKKSIYLYEEIYFTKDGYEVHMMFECNVLQYVTLRCKDIEFEL